MIAGEKRSQTIRSRVFDLKQLLGCINGATLTAEEVRTNLYVRLASAHHAFEMYRNLEATGANMLDVPDRSISAEELLDQVKGLLETDIPLLLLNYVAPEDRRQIAAEVIETLRHDELSNGGLVPLVKASLAGNSRRGFSRGIFVEFAAWLDEVVAVTIEADRNGWLAGTPNKWLRRLS